MSWRVLHLHPRTEKKMAEFCTVHAIEHYLPLRSETKIYQRRRVTVEKPVFPGYVFASYDENQRLDVLKTNIVVRELVPVREADFVNELAQVRLALSVDPTLSACRALRRGQRVRITRGPFMGVEGLVDSFKGRMQVRLNVEMIGQAVSVEIEREFLELAD
jgi:transcription antitermination factor NusG